MAGINYSHSYTSSTTRAFDSTYLGNTSRTLKAFFTGGYEQQYEGIYSRQYEGGYIGYYGKVWSVLYEGLYSKAYVAVYTKAYAGTYTGLYEGVYVGQYTHAWEGSYTHAWEGVYTGYYDRQYEGQYTGQYTHLWLGGPYTRAWEGTYTGNYQNGPWTGIYSKLWAGDRTYSGQYTGQYSHAWSHQWEGSFVGTYTGVYQSTYSGFYTIANWNGIFVSYGQAPMNYLHSSTTTTNSNYIKTYTGQYTGTFGGTAQYTGYFNVNSSYTGYYSGGLVWEGTGYFHSGGGEGGSQWSGVRQWVQSGEVSYSSTYIGVYYTYDGEPITGYWSKTWLGPAPAEGNFASTWTSLAYFSSSYVSQSGPTGSYGVAGNFVAGSIGGSYPNLQFYNYRVWVSGWESSTSQSYGASYLQSVARQWTGAAQWTGQRNHSFNKTYSRVWTGNWEGSYAGQAYYVGYWQGAYSQSVEKYFDGPNYTHVTSVTYTGLYAGYYTKLYEGQYGGSRTYAGQYTGYYTGYYGNYWQGVYTGQYEGLATYGAKTDGTGLFANTYEGVYSTQYTHAWAGSYTGYYEKAYIGYYEGTYEGAYTGQYEGVFARTREVSYSHIWEKTYVGQYGNSYGKIYTHTWLGQYTKSYVGQYTKLYGGAWLGNTPTTYVGVSGNYTSSWIGNPSYDQIYSGTTNFIGLKTGELTEGGVARIKQSGAWKQTESVHVKKAGGWKESKAIYIKEGANWVLSHIGYERTDVTISSTTQRFNLRDYLVGQGKAVSQRPQLVNIIVDGCDVHSTNTTAAMDVSTGLGAINLGSNSIKHRVRILVHPDARIIGSAGHPGATNTATRTGSDATSGGPAIRTSPAVELFIENYGTIAGGGGGGGSGGYPVTGSTLQRVGGTGGYGAGYAIVSGSITNILENNSLINGSNSAVAYGIHGGTGGLLGQRGAAAGGFNHDDASLNEANDGALKTQYANSGNGGVPGAAIIGYNATRTTFINTGNVWGDSKYKLQA